MSIGKAQIALDFSSPDATGDSVKILGKFALPDNFKVEGQRAMVDIGGLVRSFTLAADGSGTTTDGTFKLTVKTSKGVVKKQSAPFTLTLSGGNYKMFFAGEGLTATAPKGKRTVDIQLVVGNSVGEVFKTLSYSKSGNIGTAK